MESSSLDARSAQWRARSGWAFAGSLLLHALLFIALGWSPRAQSSVPFVLPVELEIGLGDSKDKELGGAAEVEGKRSEVPNQQGHDPQTRPTPPKPVRAAPPVVTPEAQGTQVVSHAVTDAGAEHSASTGDAGATDAGTPQLAGSGTADAGPVGPRRGTGGGTGSGYGVGGALLALRIDVGNVRKSALILETEALLSIVPGWQRMFAGTGLNPLQHFRRLVIATPNLHPARLGMAAELREGLRGVDGLKARASGNAPLQVVDAVEMGTWSQRGSTRRDIAFLDPRTFAIARAQDLPRLLALSRVLGESIETPGPDSDPTIAGLLHMEASESLSLHVHHVEAFVPDPSRAVPNTLAFVLTQATQYAVRLEVTGSYDSAERATAALSHWHKTYAEFAARPEVTSIGLQGAIEHAAFAQQDAQVIATTELTMAQLRYLLGQVRDLLATLVPAQAE